VHWDDDEPNFTNFLLNWDSGSQHVYKADPDTLYYGPTATGAATVRINAYDPAPQAGMRHVTFPGFFGASDHHVTGTGSLYSRRYPLNANPTSSGTFTLVGYDNVGNAQTRGFEILKDDLAPAVTLDVTPGGLLHYEVSWDISEPLLSTGQAGSGLLTYVVQVCIDAAPCQTLVTNPAASGTTTFTGDPDHTYTFRVWAKDRVDNEAEELSAPYSTSAVTKYYGFGSQRVAMRQGDAVYYLHGDHLGSVSMSTDANGNLVSQMRFTPFGEELTWEGSGASPTDFGFTGQRSERGFGLMDYNARFYSNSLGRFISADTIVPGAGNPMAYDRYAYVFNSPLNYIDPSGHRTCSARQAATGDETCDQNIDANKATPPNDKRPGTRVPGTKDLDQSIDVMATLAALEDQLGRPPTMAEILYMTAWTEFYAVGQARTLGLEGLTRVLYQTCGGPSCTQVQLVKFLSGYQPWTGYKNVVDGNPSARAQHLLDQLGRLKDKTTDPLWLGITTITMIKERVEDLSWDYVAPDEIQQWFTVLGQTGPPTGATYGYDSSDYAILGILTTDGMFYMFTYCQTLHFHNNYTDQVCE